MSDKIPPHIALATQANHIAIYAATTVTVIASALAKSAAIGDQELALIHHLLGGLRQDLVDFPAGAGFVDGLASVLPPHNG